MMNQKLKVEGGQTNIFKIPKKIILGVHHDSSYGFIIDSSYNNHLLI